MSTELQKEVVEIKKSVAGNIEVHKTTNGDVVFINTELVTPKTIDIMVQSLNDAAFEKEGHGIYSVIFRNDGYPRVNPNTITTWMFFPDSKCAVCNLTDCIKSTFDTTQNKETEFGANLSVFGGVWKNILCGFFHESHHANSFLYEREELDENEEARKIEEDKATEFGREMLFTMAKEFDTEMELSEVIAENINDMLNEDIELIDSDKESPEHLKNWATYQKHMRDNNGYFFDPAETDSDEEHYLVQSFKEFCHFCSGAELDDAEWNVNVNPTKAVEVEAKIESVQINANGEIGIPFEEDDGMPFDPDPIVTPGLEGVTQIIAQNSFTELPPTTDPIANNQQVQTPVAPGNVAPTTPLMMDEKLYDSLTLNGKEFQTTIKSLYLKIFNHIFKTCGYNPSMNPFFGQPNKIADQIPLTQTENMIAKEMTCYNTQGQLSIGTIINGWISGRFIDNAKTLPGFELNLTTPDGIKITRKFIPQNPWKKRQGTDQYSMTALEAQQGAQIMWIVDPNAVDKQFATRMYNGVLQSNNSGTWTNV